MNADLTELEITVLLFLIEDAEYSDGLKDIGGDGTVNTKEAWSALATAKEKLSRVTCCDCGQVVPAAEATRTPDWDKGGHAFVCHRCDPPPAKAR